MQFTHCGGCEYSIDDWYNGTGYRGSDTLANATRIRHGASTPRMPGSALGVLHNAT